MAESYSEHPISRSLREAYQKPVDASRVTDVEEISGHGVRAKVDGHDVYAGNGKLDGPDWGELAQLPPHRHGGACGGGRRIC